MTYYSCLLCDETADRVGSIEEHLREDHDVYSDASARWERVDGDIDEAPGKPTFLSEFSS